MNYPNELQQKNRSAKKTNKIHNHHWVYQRFPPSQWGSDDEYPDLNQIKLNQSFNWSAFSIAEWVRFKEIDGQISYDINQGVCGYKIGDIRKVKYEGITNIIDIKHVPILDNYSHCELISLNTEIWNNDKKKKNKSVRREIRMQFKHCITLLLKPNEELKKIEKIKNYVKMYCDRCY